MAKITGITEVWNTVREMDLRPLREQALEGIKISLVGADAAGLEALAARMRSDPARPEIEIQSPLLLLGLEEAGQAQDSALIVLLLPSGKPGETFKVEEGLARAWSQAGQNFLTLVHPSASGDRQRGSGPWVSWGLRHTLYGDPSDLDFLTRQFVPAVIELLNDRLLPLGRQFPLFRVAIANHLINEACFSNATYALSTGLAEIVPVFDLPLNVADMVVLSKTQAFLIYKLGLALGMTVRWQDYVAEFGGVLGGGFLWRQAARSLIGLIPAWGIIPKVGVSYAGTYVVGHVILQWYLTGRKVSTKQMQALYRQAFSQGKEVARTLAARLPRPRLRLRRRRQEALAARNTPEITLPPAALPASSETRTCPSCGRQNAADARFCQYCAQPLSTPAGEDQSKEA